MDTNYSILGVRPDAHVDDIKKAFRLHTLNSGDNFDLLANAYKEILEARENGIQSVIPTPDNNSTTNTLSSIANLSNTSNAQSMYSGANVPLIPPPFLMSMFGGNVPIPQMMDHSHADNSRDHESQIIEKLFSSVLNMAIPNITSMKHQEKVKEDDDMDKMEEMMRDFMEKTLTSFQNLHEDQYNVDKNVERAERVERVEKAEEAKRVEELSQINYLDSEDNMSCTTPNATLLEKESTLQEIYHADSYGKIFNVMSLDNSPIQYEFLNSNLSVQTEQKVYNVKLVPMEHKCFNVEHGQLIYHKTITLVEALWGFSFELEHLNGKKYNIQNHRKIIQPESEINLPGLGWKGTTNSMIIRFHVELPDVNSCLSIEQLDTLKVIMKSIEPQEPQEPTS